MTDTALENGLPHNTDAERFILGAVLQDDTRFPEVLAALTPEDFSLETHRRIFSRMRELHERSERIDRVTLANELMAHRQLELCGGVSYLVSMDEGLPELVKFESYVRIVREKARLRQIIFDSQRLIENALMDDGTPAHELAAAASHRLLQIGTSDTENRLACVGEIVRGHAGGLNRFLDADLNQRNGIRTGFHDLDAMTGGLQRGDLIVIAGRPSMGKTALALNLATHCAVGSQRLSVSIFSLEMPQDALINRLLCSEARVDSSRQRAGQLNSEEKARLRQAAETFGRARLFIDDTPAITAIDIGAKLRRLRADQGIDLCIIDYLGLIANDRKTNNRVRELGEITRYLKLFVAKELDIPVVLLSQLSRAPEARADHRPILSDLRESGDIEQDADVVAFVYRAEVYNSTDTKLRGLAELLIAKQRNGPTGMLGLLFRKKFTRFEERPAEPRQ